PGIIEAASERGADLVVMATRGAGASRFLLGSVTAKVASRAPCPVLVADRREDGPVSADFRKVVAAVDFSRMSADVVRLAGRVVAAEGELELAHVLGVSPLSWFRSRPEEGELLDEGRRRARAELVGLADSAGSARERT